MKRLTENGQNKDNVMPNWKLFFFQELYVQNKRLLIIINVAIIYCGFWYLFNQIVSIIICGNLNLFLIHLDTLLIHI